MEQLLPYGRPVTGKNLIDREEPLEEIISNSKREQSIILASSRRYGKTSVILETLQQLKKEGFLTGYVDLFEKTSLSKIAEEIVATVLENETHRAWQIIELAKKGIQTLLKNVRFKHVWKEYEIILSFGSKEVDEHSLFDSALEFPQKFAEKKKKRLFIALDEFGEFKNIDGKLIKKLRAKFQRHSMVTYIFSGSQESLMRELFTHKAQAFYGFGRIISIGPIPEEDVVNYLVNRFKKGGITISKELASNMGIRVNFHPHYLKVMAQSVLDSIRGEKFELYENDLKEGFSLALMRTKGELDEEWVALSKAVLQRRLIKFLALEGKLPYSKENFIGVDKSKIYFAITELEKKGIIRKTNRGKYAFINPFFPEYIKLLAEGV
ncbi:MAG: ATP-binding protein [bacterium]